MHDHLAADPDHRRIEARDLMERHGIRYDARDIATVALVLEALGKEGWGKVIGREVARRR